MVRAIWIAATALACSLGLTACTSSNIAFDFNASSAVGTWTSSEDFATELTLKEDGSVVATDWPIAIACSKSRVENVQALRGSERRDVVGVWEVPSEEQSYTLYIKFDRGSCAYTGGILVNVWRDENGALDLCFDIPVGVVEPAPEQQFILSKSIGEGRRDTASCR